MSTKRLAAASSALCLTLAASACMPTVGDGFEPGAGGNGNGNTDLSPDANCPSVNFTATQVIPTIQLLIDRSGSMGTTLPGTTTSRYQAMRDALVGANGVVMQLQSKARFGASLYSDDAPCPRLYTTMTRDMNNYQQVKDLIDSQGPSGNTPTPGAIDQTVVNFQANPAPMGSPPIIVLATDGLPNGCSGGDTQTETITAAANAHTAGVRTFVLGIAGLQESFLQSVANAGQGIGAGATPAKYYTANSPTELQQAFQQIIGGVVSCELSINGTVDPEAAKTGSVTLNGQQLTHGTDWTVVNGTTIRLIGGACDRLKSTTNPQVNASFNCGAVIL